MGLVCRWIFFLGGVGGGSWVLIEVWIGVKKKGRLVVVGGGWGGGGFVGWVEWFVVESISLFFIPFIYPFSLFPFVLFLIREKERDNWVESNQSKFAQITQISAHFLLKNPVNYKNKNLSRAFLPLWSDF